MSSRSGRWARVRASAAPRRQRRMAGWSPPPRDVGAGPPRNAAGRGVVEQAAGAVGAARRAVRCGGIGGIVALTEAFETGGVGVPEDAGKQARDGVDDDRGCQLAAGEDVVAHGELTVAEQIGDALVDALIPAADQHDALEWHQGAGGGLHEGATARREQHDTFAGGVAGESRGDSE